MAFGMQVSSYEQHLSEAQTASFQALQDQLHSFQNEMAAAALLRTQLVDKDCQIDTIRSPAACVVRIDACDSYLGSCDRYLCHPQQNHIITSSAWFA